MITKSGIIFGKIFLKRHLYEIQYTQNCLRHVVFMDFMVERATGKI